MRPTPVSTTTSTTPRYIQPDWFTRKVLNPSIVTLVRFGFSIRGARQLHVRRRTSGGTQIVPVNVLTLDGIQYLVAPRGATQWVRNLRAAGTASLRKGRRFQQFTAVDVADDRKTPILREYLRLWAVEVGRFFDGLDPKAATDEQLADLAPGFPVFRVDPVNATDRPRADPAVP